MPALTYEYDVAAVRQQLSGIVEPDKLRQLTELPEKRQGDGILPSRF